MTTKEMHIGLDLQLQKMNSSAYGNIRPEEKDWLLNESVLRFIKQRISPKSNLKREGFQDTIKRYDDLEEIITDVPISLYKNDDDSLYGTLPYNYFHLVKSKSKIAYDCNGLTNTSNVNVDQRIAIVPFKDAPETLYSEFKIELHSGGVYYDLINIEDYPSYEDGLATVDAKFILINLVLEEWNKIGGGAFFVVWETYDNMYYKDSFIFVHPSTTHTGIRITTDTVDEYPTFVSNTQVKYNYTITNIINGADRLIRNNEIDGLLDHPFGTTIPTSPLTILKDGRIILYHQKKFISNSSVLTIIRKPRKIDINLNQSCELNPNVHEEIVDMTVQRIKAILDSGNYKNIINENLLTE